MNACDEHFLNVSLHLDGELRGQELEDFRAHLACCVACSKQLEEQQEFSDLLHRSRPLYTVPDKLRARLMVAEKPGFREHK